MKDINKQYDVDTNHSADKKGQADWEKNYMEKIDAYLKKELKWNK